MVDIAAANLAACEAAERDSSEKVQRALAAEAAGVPEALALRAAAMQAQNLAVLRQRELVYHVARSADGMKWVIDGVPLRSAADKQHESKSGKCAQCDNPFGFFTAVATCKVCGEFRCKTCAPVVEPRPRLNQWRLGDDGHMVQSAGERIELRACRPQWQGASVRGEGGGGHV